MTFSIGPVASFIGPYLARAHVSVDPFARNSKLATYRNDLDPTTTAEFHVDAAQFLDGLTNRGIRADLVFFDPPYSPRQMKECYETTGLVPTTADTQNAALYARVRHAIERNVTDDAVVLTFGWNSTGMGRHWETLEILLVCHGSAHNDTICVAQRKPLRLL